MLTRRAFASLRGTLPVQQSTAVRSRAFTAGAATQKSAHGPALADITPESAASFTEKQKEFREGLITAQKRKEQQESTYTSVQFAACAA
jgi:hypothetical protein